MCSIFRVPGFRWVWERILGLKNPVFFTISLDEGEKMAHSVKAVANFFLDKAESEGEVLTHLKLQKLVFFAHGWHLAITGDPLIDESIQAWQYGPVIKSLYQEFKECGNGPIHFRASGHEWMRWSPNKPEVTDFATIEILNKVWDIYKGFTAAQLSAMTHAKESPWEKVLNKHGLFRNQTIPNDLIRDYFRGLAAKKND